MIPSLSPETIIGNVGCTERAVTGALCPRRVQIQAIVSVGSFVEVAMYLESCVSSRDFPSLENVCAVLHTLTSRSHEEEHKYTGPW